MSDRVRTYRPGFFARLFPQGKWKVTLRSSLPATVQINRTAPSIFLAWMSWPFPSAGAAVHSVEARSHNRIDSLSCLGEETPTRLAADLYSFINRHLFDLIGSDTKRLSEVDTKLQSNTEGREIVRPKCTSEMKLAKIERLLPECEQPARLIDFVPEKLGPRAAPDPRPASGQLSSLALFLARRPEKLRDHSPRPQRHNEGRPTAPHRIH
jgi:hypothetical protein